MITEVKNKRYLILCIVMSVLVFSFCAYTSPVFFFDGSVFFFNVAKAMVNGAVLYKDILEQKGPLIYFLYMPAYLISHISFVGIWIIHSFIVAVNSWLVFKTCRLLKLRDSACAFSVIFFSIATYKYCVSSVVEFDLLPCFLFTILTIIRVDKSSIIKKDLFVNGIMGGVVLWIKYSLMGFYFGYILCVVVILLSRKEVKKSVAALMYFSLGILTVTIPCLLYFVLGNAIQELFEYYLVLSQSVRLYLQKHSL